MNLYWLEQWLQDRGGRDPPDTRGMWGEVVSRVVRLHRRKRFHKQRLLDVFREFAALHGGHARWRHRPES